MPEKPGYILVVYSVYYVYTVYLQHTCFTEIIWETNLLICLIFPYLKILNLQKLNSRRHSAALQRYLTAVPQGTCTWIILFFECVWCVHSPHLAVVQAAAAPPPAQTGQTSASGWTSWQSVEWSWTQWPCRNFSFQTLPFSHTRRNGRQFLQRTAGTLRTLPGSAPPPLKQRKESICDEAATVYFCSWCVWLCLELTHLSLFVFYSVPLEFQFWASEAE